MTKRIEERGHPPLDSAGGGIWPLCHRKMEESKQVRDDSSASHSQELKTHQGRAQGADQAPLAAMARVSAAKSETWILVLCLRMYSMKGVLTRGTNEETGSQVSWDGP